MPTSPARHPMPALSKSSASPGISSRIFTISRSSISPTVVTTSLKNFCKSPSVSARSPSRASVSCWRARTRTSRLTRRRSVTSRHMPRSCTAAPSCTTTVTEASNQRSSRSDGPGRRYSTRYGSRVCKALPIAASTPVMSCDFKSSGAIENVPSSISPRWPWKSSSLVDQVI